ncbi:15954_t:CDS:2 [Rhizophagus irregularis]|nr:15954_t:CDS:2 [Rhizophagus irregularis]
MANHAPPKTEDASYQTRERKEDPRKYYKFLTDHDRLIGEEVLRRGILESRLSTTWLNDLMKEWKKYIQNFAQD